MSGKHIFFEDFLPESNKRKYELKYPLIIMLCLFTTIIVTSIGYYTIVK